VKLRDQWWPELLIFCFIVYFAWLYCFEFNYFAEVPTTTFEWLDTVFIAVVLVGSLTGCTCRLVRSFYLRHHIITKAKNLKQLQQNETQLTNTG